MPPDIHLKEEIILVIGNMGGDGGYSVLTPHGIVRVPGNNPMAREAVESMMKSYATLQQVALGSGGGASAERAAEA